MKQMILPSPRPKAARSLVGKSDQAADCVRLNLYRRPARTPTAVKQEIEASR